MSLHVDGSAQRIDFAWPPRYAEPWRREFDRLAEATMRPGCTILDVGSGRAPTFAPAARPEGSMYVGLDVSGEELAKAPAGSYDEAWEADITTLRPELCDRFDLVVSWQVLEHVKPLPSAFANIRRYLVPGGRCVAQLSGRYSVFALLNRMVANEVGGAIAARVMRRDRDTVFPAHYDACYEAALARMLAGWSAVEIHPRYKGAAYFNFSRTLQRLYLHYEDWTQQGRPNLATHYIVDAFR